MKFSSSRRLRVLFRLFVFGVSMFAAPAAHAAPPRIIVAYPPYRKTVAFDHVLLSGSVPRGASLKIDNRVLDVAPDGLFIEWWPLKIGENVIDLESARNGEISKRRLRVTRTSLPDSPANAAFATTENLNYATARVGIITAKAIGLGVNASTTAIRNGAGRSHILQLQRDTKFLVLGEDDKTFRCALSSNQTVHVLKSQMQLLPPETTLPRVYLGRIETRKIALVATPNATAQKTDARNPASSTRSLSMNESGNAQRNATQIRFDLPSRVPFQIEQFADDGAQVLQMRLFNCESDVDYLVSAFPDELVKNVTWRQESDGVFLARIVLKAGQQWGFFALYENDTLVLTVKNAPGINPRNPLRGLRILVDAGHGGSESGAPGAFGVDEKNLNLEIALSLAAILKKRGADVVLSRGKDTTVPLYDRALLAEKVVADISVSVHGNALPDGADPKNSRGAGVYYFQPQSRALAETLLASLLRDLPEVGNDGLHYQNLALTRPSTQLCVLVETAFLTDKNNLRLLMSARGRERFAQSLARGLEKFAIRQSSTR